MKYTIALRDVNDSSWEFEGQDAPAAPSPDGFLRVIDHDDDDAVTIFNLRNIVAFWSKEEGYTPVKMDAREESVISPVAQPNPAAVNIIPGGNSRLWVALPAFIATAVAIAWYFVHGGHF